MMKNPEDFDVIIVGGSYAGLSAAMALGRSLRKVLLMDSGKPCNAQTPHSHNFLTQDGERPEVIAEKARAQVLKYDSVEFLRDTAVNGRKTESGFTISSLSGKEFRSKKLIFATGISDIIPDIKGFAACWGISVIHCPYCHGYEARQQKTAILANGERAFHLASLVRNLSEEITILTSGKADFDADQLEKFRRHNIQVLETEVQELLHRAGQVEKVIFSDGSELGVQALYAAPGFRQHTDLPASLGCALNEPGYIQVDAFQRTNLEGIFACGDNSARMRSVANAVYSGNLTGAMVNKELVEEEF